MPLTCGCGYDFDFEPGDWYFEPVCIEKIDFELFEGKKRKRCCSCNELIDIRSPCIRYSRYRYPYTEAEARITGYSSLESSMNDEASIKMPDLFHCEKCGEIWLNLYSVGFECLYPNENMLKMMEEYRELYQPPALK